MKRQQKSARGPPHVPKLRQGQSSSIAASAAVRFGAPRAAQRRFPQATGRPQRRRRDPGGPRAPPSRDLPAEGTGPDARGDQAAANAHHRAGNSEDRNDPDAVGRLLVHVERRRADGTLSALEWLTVRNALRLIAGGLPPEIELTS